MNPYPSYKDSGVEWIGKIPSGWSNSKLKYISNLFTGNSLNDEQKRMYESNNPDDIPYVSSKDIDVNYRTVVYDNGLRIPSENNTLKIGRKGSFLLCVEGGSSGRKIVFLEQDVCFVNKLCCFESDQITKFQFYFVQSSNFQFKFKLSLTGLIGGVSISTLKNFELPFPPKETQNQIVSFLDNKTLKIDELIEKTEKKIELLKEKRTFLINHCVTKGLNPNVEMKDSGVEWIGEIPIHWDKTKLSYYCEVKDGTHDTPSYVDNGGIPLVTQKDITKGKLDFSKTKNISYEDYEQINIRSNVMKGDIIMSMIGSIGNPTIVEVDTPFSIKNVCLFKSSESQENIKFIHYLLSSNILDVELNYNSRGGVQGFVPLDVLRNLLYLKPPIDEQTQIVEYLDEQTQKIDSTIEKETQRIELLKEYRQSLISEVVTGKIDVRDWKV